MKRVFWTFLFLLFPSTIFAETLAVLLCQTEEGLIKLPIKEAMQDSLIGVAGKLTDYEIMTKENVMVILEKKGVDPNKCGEASCAVDYGRKLTADKVITCNIVKIEEECRMYLRMYDTHTAKMINSIEDSSSCSESKLLNLITSLGERLLRGEIKGKGEGILELRTTQEMVDFSIDNGEITGKVTGSRLIRLPAGRHKIKFEKEGFEPYEEEVLLERDKPKTIDVVLSPVKPKTMVSSGVGVLHIESIPEGAEVYIDGKKHEEKTPVDIMDIPAGTHTIVLKKPLYKPYMKNVIINADSITKEIAKLEENFGRVFIDTKPEGANIYIDGVYKGKTPFSDERMEAKAYKVKLQMENYYDREEVISVYPNREYRNTFELSPAFGSIIVSGMKGASVYIDDLEEGVIGDKPFIKEVVSPGRHSVLVKKKYYKSYKEDVYVREGERVEVNAVLKENHAFLTIEFPPEIEEDVEVFIDGESLGKGRMTGVKIEAGEHVIETGNPEKFKPFKQKIALSPLEHRTVKLSPVPRKGKIIVVSQPTGGTVYIDGKEVGVAPVEKEVFRGEHLIEVTKKGYYKGSKKIRIEEGETKQVKIEILKYQPARVYINVEPEAEVYIDEEYLGSGWRFEKEVEPNRTIRIIAKKKGYYDSSDEIYLTPGETKSVNLKLEKKPTWFQKKPIGFYITGNFGGLTTWGETLGSTGAMLGGSIGYYLYPRNVVGLEVGMNFNNIQISDTGLNMLYFPINIALGIKQFSFYSGISFGYQWIGDSSGGQVHFEIGFISLIKNHFLLKIGSSIGGNSISYGLNLGVVL